MDHFNLKENVEKSVLNIVVIGTFNPPIITPFWLASKELIRESEALSASDHTRIIHPEIVDYDLGWASIEVTQSRFRLKCTQEPYFEISRDLVASIFKILKETPISSFGFNHHRTIALKTKERFYEFGNKLSPLSNWSSFLKNPRVERIDILEKDSSLKEQGSVSITIYASADEQIAYGVVVNINDHYDFSTDREGKRFSGQYLLDYWDNSISISDKILVELSNSLKL